MKNQVAYLIENAFGFQEKREATAKSRGVEETIVTGRLFCCCRGVRQLRLSTSRASLRSVYHFFVAVWRIRNTECAWRERLGDYARSLSSSVSALALADDFKLINGKIYKNATIRRIEADGIVLRTKTGISTVYFVELPKDVQDRFHYGPAMPVAKQHAREAIKLEGKQDGPSRADASGWTGWQL